MQEAGKNANVGTEAVEGTHGTAAQGTPAVHLQILPCLQGMVAILQMPPTLGSRVAVPEEAVLSMTGHLQAGQEARLLVDHHIRVAGIIHACCMGEAAQRLPRPMVQQPGRLPHTA